jgi:hypothetical protein
VRRDNLGDIVVDGEDILGDGVNIAARVEGIAEPGGICLSDDAFRQVRGKVDIEFADIGEHALKNITRPVRIYHALSSDRTPSLAVSPALALPDKPSIAVLPFQNMSRDPSARSAVSAGSSSSPAIPASPNHAIGEIVLLSCAVMRTLPAAFRTEPSST